MDTNLKEHVKILIQSGVVPTVADVAFPAMQYAFGPELREYFKQPNPKSLYISLENARAQRTLHLPHIIAREAYLGTKRSVFVSQLCRIDDHMLYSPEFHAAHHVVIYGLHNLFETTPSTQTYKDLTMLEEIMLRKPRVHLVASYPPQEMALTNNPVYAEIVSSDVYELWGDPE